MSANSNRASIKGSHRNALSGAVPTGPAPADERFEVTMRIRRKTTLPGAVADASGGDKPVANRRYLSHDEYTANHGASDADIAKIEAFARAHHLVVLETSAARRSVFLSGTVANYEKAFGTQIIEFEHDAGSYRGRTGELTVPSELADIIEGVFGIDNRPVAKSHRKVLKSTPDVDPHATPGTFTPPALARLYNFPTGVDGAGQSIGIIELGGGSRNSDLKTYLQSLKLPVSTVKTVRVDGAKNTPTTANSDDGEVMLDIEVAQAIAPKAKIIVYFTTNTDKGFLDAITKAVHDTTNKPSVISISWGGPENTWTAQSLASFDAAFQSAAALGITICVAAGDSGSSDGVGDGLQHADFPASSPYALACGGTKLAASVSAITSETVWNEDPATDATGGGISDVFPLPAWQESTGVPKSANPGARIGRGLPDVAGNADPNSGYQVRIDRENTVIGGTSAVAPLWAGLIALLNQKLGKPVGYLNPLLYGSVKGTGAFRDITTGNNGSYQATTGWDPCTGWGSPNGAKLLTALGG